MLTMAKNDQFHIGLDNAEIGSDAPETRFRASTLITIWLAMIAGCFLFWAAVIHFIAISL